MRAAHEETEQVRLRLSKNALAVLRRRAEKARLPLNRYVEVVLEKDADVVDDYFRRMTCQWSFMSFFLSGALLCRTEIAGKVAQLGEEIDTIANRMFGPLPEPTADIMGAFKLLDDDFAFHILYYVEEMARDKWGIGQSFDEPPNIFESVQYARWRNRCNVVSRERQERERKADEEKRQRSEGDRNT